MLTLNKDQNTKYSYIQQSDRNNNEENRNGNHILKDSSTH